MTAQFGDLRALMQHPAPQTRWTYRPHPRSDGWVRDEAWRTHLCSLILSSYEQDPHIYEHEWLPYLCAFDEHWRIPLASYDPRNVGHWSWRLLEIAPFASFSFHMTSNALNGSTLRNPSKCERFAHQLRDFSHVNLSDHAVFPAGAESIAACEGFAHVTHLALAMCHLRDEGLFALTQSPNLQQLEHLDLSHCGISCNLALNTDDTPALPNLQTLILKDNLINIDALQRLTDPTLFPNLTHLDVSGNGIYPYHIQDKDWWHTIRPTLQVILDEV